MMDNLVAMILAGGQGARLMPLTVSRAKPAVPIAGKFRLIDVPISNCLHSDIRKIYIITQFASHSLHRHIHQTYQFPPFAKGFAAILAAEQTAERKEWYQGTADAVRQNLNHIRMKGIDYVLILSGDHLYRMDYRDMVHTHEKTGADVSVAVLPVQRRDAHHFGILKTDYMGKILDFYEKPQDEHVLNEFVPNPQWLQTYGGENVHDKFIASMGIYLFNRDVLLDILENSLASDFGREVFPDAITRYNVVAHLFKGYWEDIGTIKAFYDAMIMLTDDEPLFRFFDENQPIYTRARFLPASRIDGCEIHQSTVCEAAQLTHAKLNKCIIGIRSVVKPHAELDHVVLMGADYIETDAEIRENVELNRPNVGIGEGAVIQKAIIDKNARIGRGVHMPVQGRPQEAQTENYWIRDGILIVPKNAVIEDGVVVGE